MLCPGCKEGFYLLNKVCRKYACGKSCGLCSVLNNLPLCIACDKELLIDSILSIRPFIFAFYGIELMDIRYLENFNSDKTNCFLCPIGCFGCEYNPITTNPFALYSAKCLRCKSLKSFGLAASFSAYEWRLDPDTSSCTLCKIGDNSCWYKKITGIYVFYGGINSPLGSGTL